MNAINPSSTQIGAIAESLVANALILHSGGRLSPFAAIADDDGIDMLVYDKKSGRALAAQVKSRTVALKRRGSTERGNIVHFGVRRATFRSDREGCVILVLLRDADAIERAWVISTGEFERLAACRRDVLVVRASKADGSEDCFRPYRCDSPMQLAERVLAKLDGD